MELSANSGTGNAFHERSGWVQLYGAVVPFAAVLGVAAWQPQNAGLVAGALGAATVLTIVIQIAAHIVVSIKTPEEAAPETDAPEARSASEHAAEVKGDLMGGRIMSVGVVLGALALYAQRIPVETPPASLWQDPILVAHGLVLVLVVSEAVRLLRGQIVRRHGV